MARVPVLLPDRAADAGGVPCCAAAGMAAKRHGG